MTFYKSILKNLLKGYINVYNWVSSFQYATTEIHNFILTVIWSAIRMNTFSSEMVTTLVQNNIRKVRNKNKQWEQGCRQNNNVTMTPWNRRTTWYRCTEWFWPVNVGNSIRKKIYVAICHHIPFNIICDNDIICDNNISLGTSTLLFGGWKYIPQKNGRYTASWPSFRFEFALESEVERA